MTLEERAKIARDSLFHQYDELNALWLQAEEQLTQFHIPRPVFYPYAHYHAPDNPPDALTSKYLALEKVKGKWRICAGLYDEWCDRDYGCTPITECSAHIRVEAAKHLDKLRAKVVESAEDFIPKVDEAIKKLAAAVGRQAGVDSRDLGTKHAKLNGQRN